jgi:hypothetical protein
MQHNDLSYFSPTVARAIARFALANNMTQFNLSEISRWANIDGIETIPDRMISSHINRELILNEWSCIVPYIESTAVFFDWPHTAGVSVSMGASRLWLYNDVEFRICPEIVCDNIKARHISGAEVHLDREYLLRVAEKLGIPPYSYPRDSLASPLSDWPAAVQKMRMLNQYIQQFQLTPL